MFSYSFYKVVHIFGILLTWSALGALVLHAANGGDKSTNKKRGLVAATHGIGMVIILVGGFGLLARIGQMHGSGFPVWIWIKLGIWVLTGALIMLPLRVPKLATPLWFLIPMLGGVAAYTAGYKPFQGEVTPAAAVEAPAEEAAAAAPPAASPPAVAPPAVAPPAVAPPVGAVDQ